MDGATRAARAIRTSNAKSVSGSGARREFSLLTFSANSSKGDRHLATAAIPMDFINIVATEMLSGVERAVEYWLAQIDEIVMNDKLTPSLKLITIHGVLQNYKRLTGKNF